MSPLLPNDDTKKVSRRGILILIGSALLPRQVLAQARVAASSSGRPLCVATPEQTEGPYFVDSRLNRADIRTDATGGPAKQGVPLTLKLTVSSLGSAGCVPLQGAMVDIWHCDAEGAYSAVEPAFGRGGANAKKPFLRGYQITSADGGVQFLTIYPGWYPGRAVHIHFKIRTQSASGRQQAFTSQLYFDDAVTGRVHARPPYSARGRNPPKNNNDSLFTDDGGQRLMLALTETAQGYAGTFDIALQSG